MEKVSIVDFGAVSSCTELQTEKIQNAIDHCFLKGGGEVVIPEGTFYTGDIRLRSDITLHLLENARLVASTNPEDYFNHLNDKIEPIPKELICNDGFEHVKGVNSPLSYEQKEAEQRFKRVPCSRWNNAIIRAINAKNVKIIGEKGCVIDGSNCFDSVGSEENYRGPHGITFVNCENIEFKGYTIQNTANWAHNIRACKNIMFDKVTALGGHDGIDIFACTNTIISNCEFYTGDDCLAGFGNVNTFVTNCVLNSSCSAMRFGGTNAIIDNCHIYGPGKYCFRGSLTDEEKRAMVPSTVTGKRNNMLSAITYYADYSMPINETPGNIVISNCKIENTDRFLHYNFSGSEIWQQTKALKSIEFCNINATDISMPINAYGSPDLKVDVKLSNVSIKLKEGFEDIDLIQACNYHCIILDNVSVENFKGDAAVRIWSEGNILIRNPKGFSEASVKKSTKEFETESISEPVE